MFTLDNDTDHYLNQLDSAQRAAVEYNDGPSLILAGAGSGKTRVLVYKLLHLINLGYNPSNLMALTFTNKAAREMRARMYSLVGNKANRIQMGTFHSIFYHILRQHAEFLGYSANFTIYNNNDSKTKVKNIIKVLGLDDKVYKPGVVYGKISRAKNYLKSPEGYKLDNGLIVSDVKANMPKIYEIYSRYAWELKQANAMDFDDLLFQTYILFKEYPDVLQMWQERVQYLLIDEYQDTNFAQDMIAQQLMLDKGKICVVGDDAQSIYSFRGANLSNMLNFQKVFKGAKIFRLEQNYRSTQTIVQAAKHVIAHNTNQLQKEVFSLGEIGDKIELHGAESGEAEASWVVRTIENIRHKMGGLDYDAFAVLYRTNQQSRLLEQKLRAASIPFRIWGGRSFFDHKEIMDVMAYFRLMVNEYDDEAMYRIINYPKRGIGDTTISRLRQQAVLLQTSVMNLIREPEHYDLGFNKGTVAKLKSFANLLDDMRSKCASMGDFYELSEWLITTTGIPAELLLDTSPEGKGRRDNIQELLVSLEEYQRHAESDGREVNLENYLSEVSLMTDQDQANQEEVPSVTLMTIHASKGLEFPHVFIVGLEEMLFPSPMSSEAQVLEEERRLFYVALTRAEKSCHLGYAQERFRNGRTEHSRPSRFIREIPNSLLKRNATASETYYVQERRQNRWGGDREEGTHIPTHFSVQDFLPTHTHTTGGKRVHLERREGGKDAPAEPQHTSVGVLRVGGRVSHTRFGDGVLKVLEGSGDNIKAIVCFDSGEEKKLLLRFANLIPLD